MTRVIDFDALKIVPASAATAARSKFGAANVSIGHIVVAFRLKRDPSGALLGDGLSKKTRITIADKAASATSSHHDFYSACVGTATDRFITQIAVERRALQHTKDVSGAYYNGTPIPPEDGGRLVFAFVPTWLADFGDFPTHGPDGSRNLILVIGNKPRAP